MKASKLSAKSYALSQPKLKFKFPAFPEDSGGQCGAVMYTCALVDGSKLPSFIKLNSQTRGFEVETGDEKALGKYQIVVMGALTYASASLKFKLTITPALPSFTSYNGLSN